MSNQSQQTKCIGIIFGRFNPPHLGHKAAWEMASKCTHWFVGTNQSTQGPKDPLPYEVKIAAMEAIWPGLKGHIVAEITWLTMAANMYEQFGDLPLHCFTDEDWVVKTLLKYNNVKNDKGQFYNFSVIEQKKPPRLSSATALRKAVKENDRIAFEQAAGVSADLKITNPIDNKAYTFFDLVQKYLSVYESTEHIEEAHLLKYEDWGWIAPDGKKFHETSTLRTHSALLLSIADDPKYAAKYDLKPNKETEYTATRKGWVRWILDKKKLHFNTINWKPIIPLYKAIEDIVNKHWSSAEFSFEWVKRTGGYKRIEYIEDAKLFSKLLYAELKKAPIKEEIVKKNKQYYLYSKDRKKLLGGPYSSRKSADNREKQVQFFKNL